MKSMRVSPHVSTCVRAFTVEPFLHRSRVCYCFAEELVTLRNFLLNDVNLIVQDCPGL